MEAHLNPKPSPPPGYVEPTLNNNDGSSAPIEQDAGKVCNPEFRTVTDPAEIRAVLDRLPVGAKVELDWSGSTHKCEVKTHSAWGKCAYGDCGIFTMKDVGTPYCTWFHYRLSDDPQATPAKETPFVPVSREDFNGFRAAILRETEYLKEQVRVDNAESPAQRHKALASRVEELERQVIHESRCRVELEGNMESMHLRFTESIAALRRDVEAIKSRHTTCGPCNTCCGTNVVRNSTNDDYEECPDCKSRPDAPAQDGGVVRVYFAVPTHYTIGNAYATYTDACVAARATITPFSYGGHSRAFVDVRLEDKTGDRLIHRVEIFPLPSPGDAREADKGGKYVIDTNDDGLHAIAQYNGAEYNTREDRFVDPRGSTKFASLEIALAVAAALEKRA